MLVIFILLPIPAVLIPEAFRFIFPIVYSLLILCGIRAVADHKKHSGILIIWGVLSFILIWVSFFDATTFLLACAKSLSLFAFFIYLAIRLFKKARSIKEVNLEVIYSAISGYLLLGLLGGLLFQGLELIMPGSFSLSNPNNNLNDLNYFSFVSLTTVGFGDILPLNQASKSLVVLLSITGQLYLTILIALLVGKYLSNKTV